MQEWESDYLLAGNIARSKKPPEAKGILTVGRNYFGLLECYSYRGG